MNARHTRAHLNSVPISLCVSVVFSRSNVLSTPFISAPTGQRHTGGHLRARHIGRHGLPQHVHNGMGLRPRPGRISILAENVRTGAHTGQAIHKGMGYVPTNEHEPNTDSHTHTHT